MNTLDNIITYVRRIIKSPNNNVITDALIIDYINRFWIMDVDPIMQLFDLKTKYQFITRPGVDKYNMPLYDVQRETNPPLQEIKMYPVYQGFLDPVFIDGVQVSFQTQKTNFFNYYPNVIQELGVIAVGDGSNGPYQIQFPIGINNSTPINPPITGILRGHVDITGIIAGGTNVDPPLAANATMAPILALIPTTSIIPAVYITSINSKGENIVVSDSGIFFNDNVNLGMLIEPGKAPFGNSILPGGYLNSFIITGIVLGATTVITATTSFSVGQIITVQAVFGTTELNGNMYTVTAVTSTTVTIDVDSSGFTPYISGGDISSIQNMFDYFSGSVQNLFFPDPVPVGANISAKCYYYNPGLPRAILYNNNTITMRSPPDNQYMVELDAYLSPSAFFNTEAAIPFAYMAEYIARGAARKILSDTGDVEQMQFYEPLFKEQESFVWKRSQRQFTANRTETIYSQGMNNGRNGSMGVGSSGY